jgi:hypothetical protein
VSARLDRARLAWRVVVDALKHEPFTGSSKLAAEIRADLDRLMPPKRDGKQVP